ncbi:homoserine kinase [Rarobacter faecitabidus]|uniref:Homoserine kinase n=1 Tax=Rarobacter faecitabidus TaxID=13243 RepID=A0A542ZX69_RARFA|nr:homoserine kinase [Rarobacter faecitabidus]TQL64947.1 homoserine kinase [Rarobacter faecitabidus]
MQLRSDHVEVSVPATSANLGPGFDALGLAVNLRDTIRVRALATPSVQVDVEGEGADGVPTDERHLVARAIRVGLEYVGAPNVGLHLTCRNVIPHARGLGSSAAACVGGLLAARGLISDSGALDDDAILALATQMEGHPDNAAPAILGGATVAWMGQDPDGSPVARATRFTLADDIDPIVLIPDTTLATKAARAALPAEVPHRDASFNAGRSALLVAALSQHPEFLLDATADRLHQGFRGAQMPSSTLLVERLRSAGLAAVISGAGPTVLVLGTRSGRAEEDEAIAGITGRWDEDGTAPGGWRVLRPGVAHEGASCRVVGA